MKRRFLPLVLVASPLILVACSDSAEGESVSGVDGALNIKIDDGFWVEDGAPCKDEYCSELENSAQTGTKTR